MGEHSLIIVPPPPWSTGPRAEACAGNYTGWSGGDGKFGRRLPWARDVAGQFGRIRAPLRRGRRIYMEKKPDISHCLTLRLAERRHLMPCAPQGMRARINPVV